MANLIITVIAIGLVAAAALMSAYFGGSAFLSGSNEAAQSTCDNMFSQEDAAMQLYQANDSATAAPTQQSQLTNAELPDHPNAYLSSTFFTDAPDDTIVGTDCASHPNSANGGANGFQLTS